jgi:GLPGLI family protein
LKNNCSKQKFIYFCNLLSENKLINKKYRNLMKNSLKTVIVMMAILIAYSSSVFAQKKAKPFKGTITYGLEYSGEGLEPAQLAQMPKEEVIKVYENLTLTEQSPATIITNGDLKKVSVIIDLSSYGMKKYLIVKKEDDVEKDYKGTDIKYFEDSKEILGYKTKKAIITAPVKEDEEDGSSGKIVVYYTEELGGAEVNFGSQMFHGLKGVALEFEASTKKMTIKGLAKTVEKGKVKETDFLIPTGCTETTMEAFQEEMKALRGGGGDD